MNSNLALKSTDCSKHLQSIWREHNWIALAQNLKKFKKFSSDETLEDEPRSVINDRELKALINSNLSTARKKV